MKKIEWSDTYLLGIPEIDSQHKKLVGFADDLFDASSSEEDTYKSRMKEVLKNLIDYTVYHFSQEENFLKKYGYAGFDIHKTAHDGFIGEVNHQVSLLTEGDREDGMKFYSYIVNWILNHIAKADKVWASSIKPKIKDS